MAASAANRNGIKILLATGLSTFLVKTTQFLLMVLKVYLKIILIILFFAIEIFDSVIVADKLFAKALQSFGLVY